MKVTPDRILLVAIVVWIAGSVVFGWHPTPGDAIGWVSETAHSFLCAGGEPSFFNTKNSC